MNICEIQQYGISGYLNIIWEEYDKILLKGPHDLL